MIHQLNELEEFYLQAYENTNIYKEKTKKWHDRKIMCRKPEPRLHVLLYNSRLEIFPRKLKLRWPGPFVITQVLPYGAVELLDHNTNETFKVNSRRVMK